MIATVIFICYKIKGQAEVNDQITDIDDESKQQQPSYFFYEQYLNSSWTAYGDIISFLNTVMECYCIECSGSSMRPTCHELQATELMYIVQHPLVMM